MKESINFQDFGVSQRIEHKIDLSVKLQITEKLIQTQESLITGLFLGKIEGDKVIIKNIIFPKMFNYTEAGLSFNRETTDNIVNHYKQIFNLSVVGWFINKQLEDEVTTMHITLSIYKSTQFLLVTGLMSDELIDLELVAYNSLANKYFKTCFGALDKVPLVVDVCNDKYKRVLKELIGEESGLFRELKDVLDGIEDQELDSNPRLKKEVFLVLTNKFNFSKSQIESIENDFLNRYNNYSDLLDAFEKEILNI